MPSAIKNTMQIRSSVDGDTAIVHLAGNIDLALYRKIIDLCALKLHSPDVIRLELDLSGIHSCNSAVLGLLVLVRDHAMKQRKSVYLSKPSKSVMEVLELMQFQRLFNIA